MIDKETTGLVDRMSAVVATYSHRVGDERAGAIVETLFYFVWWVKRRGYLAGATQVCKYRRYIEGLK